jgi:hypothetical protein
MGLKASSISYPEFMSFLTIQIKVGFSDLLSIIKGGNMNVGYENEI